MNHVKHCYKCNQHCNVIKKDLGLKLSARPSTETVVFRDRAIPDQVPPGRCDGDEDDGDEDMGDDGDGDGDGDEDMGDGDHYVHPD